MIWKFKMIYTEIILYYQKWENIRKTLKTLHFSSFLIQTIFCELCKLRRFEYISLIITGFKFTMEIIIVRCWEISVYFIHLLKMSVTSLDWIKSLSFSNSFFKPNYEQKKRKHNIPLHFISSLIINTMNIQMLI